MLRPDWLVDSPGEDPEDAEACALEHGAAHVVLHVLVVQVVVHEDVFTAEKTGCACVTQVCVCGTGMRVGLAGTEFLYFKESVVLMEAENRIVRVCVNKMCVFECACVCDVCVRGTARGIVLVHNE